MTWVLDGSKVSVNYLGVECSGTVVESRVKYGGALQYTIVLNDAITLPWRSEPVNRVLVSDRDILMLVSTD
jgi:hypothetical protein